MYSFSAVDILGCFFGVLAVVSSHKKHHAIVKGPVNVKFVRKVLTTVLVSEILIYHKNEYVTLEFLSINAQSGPWLI